MLVTVFVSLDALQAAVQQGRDQNGSYSQCNVNHLLNLQHSQDLQWAVCIWLSQDGIANSHLVLLLHHCKLLNRWFLSTAVYLWASTDGESYICDSQPVSAAYKCTEAFFDQDNWQSHSYDVLRTQFLTLFNKYVVLHLFLIYVSCLL